MVVGSGGKGGAEGVWRGRGKGCGPGSGGGRGAHGGRAATCACDTRSAWVAPSSRPPSATSSGPPWPPRRNSWHGETSPSEPPQPPPPPRPRTLLPRCFVGWWSLHRRGSTWRAAGATRRPSATSTAGASRGWPTGRESARGICLCACSHPMSPGAFFTRTASFCVCAARRCVCNLAVKVDGARPLTATVTVRRPPPLVAGAGGESTAAWCPLTLSTGGEEVQCWSLEELADYNEPQSPAALLKVQASASAFHWPFLLLFLPLPPPSAG